MKYIINYTKFRQINEKVTSDIIENTSDIINKLILEYKTSKELLKTVTKLFDTTNELFIFKSILNKFKLKDENDNESCLNVLNDMINPETGVIGKQGLELLTKNKNKENLSILFVINSIRKYMIIESSFAGGKKEVDQNLISSDMNDTKHLNELKRKLRSTDDNKEKSELTLKWVNSLILDTKNYINNIKMNELEDFLLKNGIKATEYKIGDLVAYKKDDFDQVGWDKLVDKKDSSKYEDLGIGIKKILKIEGEVVKFEDSNFTKKISDILIKTNDIKNNSMKSISDFNNLYKDPIKNKEKIEKISNILKGEN